MIHSAVEPKARRVSCAGAVPSIPPCAGRSLRASDGPVLGRISGFVVEDGCEGVLFAVVCFASVSRLGDDARVVPWALIDDDGETCTIRLSASAVRSAPIFVAGTCCSDTAFWNRVEDHFRRHAA